MYKSPKSKIQKNNPRIINWATRPGSVGRNQPFMTYLAENDVNKNVTIPFRNIILRYCAQEISWEKCLRKILNVALDNLDLHFKNYQISQENLFDKAKEICANLGKISNKELLKLHGLYFNKALRYGVYLILPFAISEYLEPEIY